VVSLEELRTCGLSEAVVGGWVAAGHLHRVHHGVYAVGHAGLTPEGRWLAAVKACGPDAILGRTCSLMLFELWPVRDRRPEVTVPHGQVRAPAGIRVHRTRSLHPEDVVRHRGIPTTSAARTIMDLAATLEDVPLRRLMSRAQSMHLTNLRLLASQLDRAAGRPGRARFARVLATQPPATRSELEDRVHDLLAAAGLAPPHVNVPLHLDGRRVIPDFRWPEHHLIVEADSAQWHDTPQARIDDAERQALLEAHGEHVLRITWQQATAHAAQTVRRVAAALALPRLGPTP
jgi:very-short-patch-repair endonuclease